MSQRRFCLALISLVVLTTWRLSAQPEIPILGSGDSGVIQYSETVSGEIELSDDDNVAEMESIRFVGHNGSGRVQGDFDVWDFDMPKNTYSVMTVTATSGDLIPTLLIVNEPHEDSIIAGVS